MIGSAGSPEKVAWLQELGFDETFDYRETDAREALREGIDLYFDNVGGETLEVALSALRQHGRVVACGAISQYNATERPPGPRNMSYVVTKRLRIEGFIVIDHFDKFPAFLAEVGPWVRDGKVAYRETVVDGLERAPEALLGLLTRREHREDARQDRAGRVSLRCRLFGHKVPKARWFFLTERFQRCERCGERVQPK